MPKCWATAAMIRSGRQGAAAGHQIREGGLDQLGLSGVPLRSLKASTRVRAPSSSRMLLCTRRAIISRYSGSTARPARSAFERRMATRVSKSGGWMSAVRPHSKRERRRSSSVTRALGAGRRR